MHPFRAQRPRFHKHQHSLWSRRLFPNISVVFLLCFLLLSVLIISRRGFSPTNHPHIRAIESISSFSTHASTINPAFAMSALSATSATSAAAGWDGIIPDLDPNLPLNLSLRRIASGLHHVLPPQMTSLICLGPAKSGTSSFSALFGDFIDIQWWNHENHYWESCNSETHKWSRADWSGHLSAWVNGTLSIPAMAAHLASDEPVTLNYYELQHQQAREWFHNSDRRKRTLHKLRRQGVPEHLLRNLTGTLPMECNRNHFRNQWVKPWDIMQPSGPPHRLHVNLTCRNPATVTNYEKYASLSDLDDLDDLDGSGAQRFCWLFDKAPGYLMQPVLAFAFSSFYPGTKMLVIARNPYNQVMSYVHHFGQYFHMAPSAETYVFKRNEAAADSVEELLYHLLARLLQRNDFAELSRHCGQFAHALESLQLRHVTTKLTEEPEESQKLEQTFARACRALVAYYLTEAYGGGGFIKYSEESSNEQRARAGAFFNAQILPALLAWVHVYEERFGKDQNLLRVVQHEWLYSDLMQSMSLIKCWLQTDRQFRFDTIGKAEDYWSRNNWERRVEDYVMQQCPEAYFDDRSYYKRVKTKSDKQGKLKLGATRSSAGKDRRRDERYTPRKFDELFCNCSSAVMQLLRYRRELLLGEWVSWSDVGYEQVR